ncbi:MAG: glycosyltransferase family 39 protein [Planctomycetaceae bacterium]|nr:glycosyltransferase family 39 protein [Planctomycetaceae bacterium]
MSLPPAEAASNSRIVRTGIVVLLLASGLSFFTGLGVPALWDQDEGFFASTALEMHRRNDWIVPTFNGSLFDHKPPFMFWMMRIGYLLCGENEWGARLFSAVFGCGTALITFLIGWTLFPNRNRQPSTLLAHPGFWAGLAMSSCLMFTVVSRAATPDSYLVFWISFTLLLYLRSVRHLWVAERLQPGWTAADLLPRRWRDWVAIYAAMGVAVLVKGPIGILLPGATIGLFAILATVCLRETAKETNPVQSRLWLWFKGLLSPLPWRTMWSMHPWLAIAVVLLVAGPWFAIVGLKTNGEFLTGFFGTHNFGRFMQPMENHRGSLFYYLPAILIGFFPWSIVWLPMTLDLFHRVVSQRPIDLPRLFLSCWLTVMIGFFSIASTKLPSYVLPAYPALALVTGAWLVDWAQAPQQFWRGWAPIAFSVLMLVGATVLIGIPALSWQVRDQTIASMVNLNPGVLVETVPLMLIGLIPLLCGAICLWFWRRRQTQFSLEALGVGNLAFCLALLAGGAIRVDQHQFTRDVVRLAQDSTTEVAVFGYFQPSMVFYASRPVARVSTIEEVETILDAPGRTLIMTSQGKADLEREAPLQLEVIATRPNFPKPGELLLVRKPGTNHPPIANASRRLPGELIPTSHTRAD